MSYVLTGNGGTNLEVDSNRNVLISVGLPYISSVGGPYSVTGGTSALVAASLAANTSLVSFRSLPTTQRNIYIDYFKLMFTVGTVGTSALVSGSLGLQKFYGATPSGGTARTVARHNAVTGSASTVDVRDNNAALTVTGVTFTDVLSYCHVPIWIDGSADGTTPDESQWLVESDECPIVLMAGEGLAVRTQVAGPLTQTWGFSYEFRWWEG